MVKFGLAAAGLAVSIHMAVSHVRAIDRLIRTGGKGDDEASDSTASQLDLKLGLALGGGWAQAELSLAF